MKKSLWLLLVVMCLIGWGWVAGASDKQQHEHHKHDKHHKHHEHHEHREQGARQHGVHVHGQASLSVVQEGGRLQVEFDSPALNLVGFEHLPRTEQQHAAVQAARQKLQQSERVLVLPTAAACVLAQQRVDSDWESAQPGQQDARDQHADFRVYYGFDCQQPARLNQLTVKIFDHFGGYETVAVQWIIGDRQGVAAATPAGRVVRFHGH